MITVAFFGTHQFAAIILQALLNESSIKIVLVITQPDRASDRKQVVKAGPIKQLAQKNLILVKQPTTLKNYQFPIYDLELGVTAQYGELIPNRIITIPKYGILNVHPSLLPKYRGASPIQAAIRSGENETGVTIMKMDEGLDTGPIILQKKLTVGPDETYPQVESRLATLGALALLEAIPRYLAGSLEPKPQDETQATYCRELTRADGHIDWRKSAPEIYNRYRALTPWPGVWTTWQGKRIKLLDMKPIAHHPNHEPGRVLVNNRTILVVTGHGMIEVLRLQLEGKKPMTTADFLLGHNRISTAVLA